MKLGKLTRRDVLKLAGGSALGFLFTPMLWKSLDDSAIWTQNWSLIPPLPRGPISFKYSTCTLCPAGCALKARCVGSQPVSLTGVTGHPVSHGVLCPIGLAGHHLAYHPLRLRSPHAFSGRSAGSKLQPISLDEAIRRISRIATNVKADESIAILDQCPNRAISGRYQEFLRAHAKGIYLTPPSRECTTLTTLAEMIDGDAGSLGFDYEHTHMILSFGAPILDGWGTPGRMINLFNERRQRSLRLVQVESRQSRTAMQADRWLPAKPGTEAALALGIAHVIIASHSYRQTKVNGAADFPAYKELTAQFTPSHVCEITGIEEDLIIKTAEELLNTGSSIVIAGCDPGAGPLGKQAGTAIAGLNLLLGNVGRIGGVVMKRTIPDGNNHLILTTQLADVPDHSIRLLILDAAESGYAFPWQLVERKLVPETGTVVSLSPYLTGLAAHADYAVPAPAHLESMQDVPGPTDARTATYALAPALLPVPDGATEPAEFIARLAAESGLSSVSGASHQELIRHRIESLLASRRGIIHMPAEGNARAVVDIAEVKDLEELLMNGGIWIDDEIGQKHVRRHTLLNSRPHGEPQLRSLTPPVPIAADELLLVPFGWRGAVTSGHVSPILSKVFQESELRSNGGVARINPSTAKKHGLTDGGSAKLLTSRGSCKVTVRCDSAVMPGVLHVALGPSPNGIETLDNTNSEHILSVCDVKEDGTWRVTGARIQKA